MSPLIKGTAYSFDKPGIGSLAAERIAFAGRYVGGDPAKTLTSSEFTQLSAAYIPVFLIHETTADWMLGGWEAGVTAAQLARGGMDAAGVPLTTPVFPAADFDVQESQLTTVLAAAAGFASIHGESRTGIYGGLRVATAAADSGMRVYQTEAWSHDEHGDPVWEPRAVLRQIADSIDVGGIKCDQVQAVGFDFGQYTPPPPPWPGRIFSYHPGAPEIHGQDVLAWQQRMHVRGWPLAVDGWFGPQSASVAEAFQAEFHVNPAPGLMEDAEVGPRTWAAAFTIPITS